MNTTTNIVSEPTSPTKLIQIAIEKGVDIAQLEKLMDLQDRWEKKEAKKSFLEAISSFQSSVPYLKKNKIAKIVSKNGAGTFSYKYADIGSIAEQLKKPLRENGLSYRWEFSETNGIMRVTCFISHRDGHTEQTSMEAGKDDSGAKNNIQQKGSTQTYLQRYTLIGALGLSTAEGDNDGNNGTDLNIDKKETTEKEVMEQWETLLGQVKNKIELQRLYFKNKNVVDNNDKIKVMFKAREKELTALEHITYKVDMP